jgi:hypothetical protein
MAHPGEDALKLLYGLAITHQKSNELDKAIELLDGVCDLSGKCLEEFDFRNLEIFERRKAVKALIDRGVRHHKTALLASTVRGS